MFSSEVLKIPPMMIQRLLEYGIVLMKLSMNCQSGLPSLVAGSLTSLRRNRCWLAFLP